MSKVDEAIHEIDAALADIAPKHEGLRDYARLNIQPATKAQVDAAIALYDTRVALLTTAKSALSALVGDGHPALEIPDVSLSVYDDLQEQHRTITAALGEFEANAALTLGLQASPPEPK